MGQIASAGRRRERLQTAALDGRETTDAISPEISISETRTM